MQNGTSDLILGMDKLSIRSSWISGMNFCFVFNIKKKYGCFSSGVRWFY